MQAHAKEKDSTCLSLRLSKKTRCLTCGIVADSSRKTKNRRPCMRGWDEGNRNHLSKRIREVYYSIWDEINNPPIEPPIEPQRGRRLRAKRRGENDNIRSYTPRALGKKSGRRRLTDGCGTPNDVRERKKSAKEGDEEKKVGDDEGVSTGALFLLGHNLPQSSGKNIEDSNACLLETGQAEQHQRLVQEQKQQQELKEQEQEQQQKQKEKSMSDISLNLDNLRLQNQHIETAQLAPNNYVHEPYEQNNYLALLQDTSRIANLAEDTICQVLEKYGQERGYHKLGNLGISSIIEEHAANFGYKKRKQWRGSINLSKKTKLEKDHEHMKEMQKFLKRMVFDGSKGREFSKRLFGLCVAMSPKASLNSLELTIALARIGFADDLKLPDHLDVSLGHIPNISPGHGALGIYLGMLAVDCMFSLHIELAIPGLRIFLLCDKGQSDAFVKILAWWCKKTKRVKTAFLDIDKTGGTSADCAHAIKHSTDRLCLLNFILAGGVTDSGGGGTGASFQRELDRLDLICKGFYMKNFCDMHIVQLTFKNPAERALGMTGIGSRSALQAIFQVFYLQDETDTIVWKKTVEHICNKEGLTLKRVEDDTKHAEYIMPSPVMTRWWTVGQAVRYINQNLALFKKLPTYFIYGSSTTKIQGAASDLFSLLKEKAILADMILIDQFCTHYLHPCFQWLQTGDSAIGGTPGFKTRLAFTRYFVMDSMLGGWCDDGWKQSNTMKPYKNYLEKEGTIFDLEEESDDDEENEDDSADQVSADDAKDENEDDSGGATPLQADPKMMEPMSAADDEAETLLQADPKATEPVSTDWDDPSLPKETVYRFVKEGTNVEDIVERDFNLDLQEKKTNQFFRLSRMSLHKHLAKYGRDLVVYALFGEAPTAKIVAKHLLRHENLLDEADSKIYLSEHQAHKKGQVYEIDLEKFASYVKEKIDAADVMVGNVHLLRAHRLGYIAAIAGGLDIWNDRNGSQIKEYYEENYAALSNSTHMVEGGVNEAKLTDNGSRTEMRMTHYGLAVNAKKEINRRTREAMIQQKSEKGGDPYKDEDHLEARGKEKSIQTVKYVAEIHADISMKMKTPYYAGIYDKISASLTKESEGYNHSRADVSFKKFLARTEDRKKKNEGGLAATKAQRSAGYEVTPLMRGAVLFHDVRRTHASLLGNELSFRNIPFEMDDGIKKLVNRLKEDLKQKQHDNIKKAGPRDKDIKVKKITHFIPQAASYYDYYPDLACGNGEEALARNTSQGESGDAQQDNISNAELDEGTIDIGKIRKKDHLDLILNELLGRGVSVSQEDSIRINQLKKLLKKNEMERRKMNKMPMSFRPLHTSYCSYKITK